MEFPQKNMPLPKKTDVSRSDLLYGSTDQFLLPTPGYVPGGGGVLPYMSYIGMCRCEGYGFQRVYCRIGYRNQRVLV